MKTKQELLELVSKEEYTLCDFYMPSKGNCMMVTVNIGNHQLRNVEIPFPNYFTPKAVYDFNTFSALFNSKLKANISTALISRIEFIASIK